MTLDPRWLIAESTDFVDHDIAAGRHAVIVELAARAKRSAKQALDDLARALGAEGAIEAAYATAPAGLRVATGEVTREGLRRLEGLVQPGSGKGRLVERFEYAQPLRLPRQPAWPGMAWPEGLDAVTAAGPESTRSTTRELFAVIDFGCPFAHPLLRTGAGANPSTRVRALWDQQGRGSEVSRPPGFSYGTEFSRAQLDAVIRAAQGDEARAYALLGCEALRQRRSHGAHSLGMLLDDGRRPRAAAPRDSGAELLFVQLPQHLLGAPSRPVLSRHLIDALLWIEAHRERDERVILSLGEGTSQGPNDGSSMVELALEAFAKWGAAAAPDLPTGLSRNRVYLAVGNGGDERLHAQATLEPDHAATLTWRVPPASELPATVEVWLPTRTNGTMAGVRIELLAPDGTAVFSLAGAGVAHWPAESAAAASIAASGWAGRGCTLCLIRLAPTAISAGRVCAPYGDWRVRLTTREKLPGPVHLYIGRIKQALGFPLRTAQSTFVSGNGAGHLGASKAGTLQGLASARGVLRVGGYVGSGKRKLARYSARGPSRDGSIKDADLLVKVDSGDVLKGRRSIGNLGGVTFRMDGTSVAAPLAANLDRTTAQPTPVDPGAAGRAAAAAPARPKPAKRLSDRFDDTRPGVKPGARSGVS